MHWFLRLSILFFRYYAVVCGMYWRGVEITHVAVDESEAAAQGKRGRIEASVRAGTKDSRDAHSASLPALRVATAQGWWLP